MGVTGRWARALPKKNKNVVLRTWEPLKRGGGTGDGRNVSANKSREILGQIN